MASSATQLGYQGVYGVRNFTYGEVGTGTGLTGNKNHPPPKRVSLLAAEGE